MLSLCPEDFVSLSKTRALITENAPSFAQRKEMLLLMFSEMPGSGGKQE
jgi:hypothetical protein